jgi:quercetin dioxygenase-like cupin family protein
MRIFLMTAVAVSLLSAVALAQQQTAAPKMTPIAKAAISGQPDKEFISLIVEWPTGASTAAHTHLGDEYGYVLEGSYMVKQSPGDWTTYAAGQSWHVPAGVVHESKPSSPGTKTINSFIVEKGKPLINPVK